MDKCLALKRIEFNKEVVDFFRQNQEDIIKSWTIYPTLFDILNEFDISHKYYTDNVARPVYEYFTTIISGENEPGDCPVMRNIIDIFYEKGFKVEDVFLSCTAFKNVLNFYLYQQNIITNVITNIMMILDANLSSIIGIYSQKIEEKDKLIKQHTEIIQNHVLLTITDTKGIIIHTTEAFCNLSGYTKEELIGNTHSVISNPNEEKAFFSELWETISSGEKWHGKLRNYTKEGKLFVVDTIIIPVKDDNGTIIEYMAIREDITEKEVFQYDALTKVYTRRVFDEKLDQLLKESQNSDQHFSIILSDLDHFKKVNDTYGHDKGDEIIQNFTKVIAQNIRNKDMCFRWGGEEFIILLPFAPIDIAKQVANRIREDFSKTIHINNNYQSASFGVTQLQNKDNKESLFKRVDNALYVAKQNGRNQVQVIR